MQGAVNLGSLLVLGLAWMLQAGPVLQDDLIPIQENFDLGQVSGLKYRFYSFVDDKKLGYSFLLHLFCHLKCFALHYICLLQFMGKWNEVAVVSSCPYYMDDKRENPVIVALDLQQVAPDGNFTMTSARFRSVLQAFLVF